MSTYAAKTMERDRDGDGDGDRDRVSSQGGRSRLLGYGYECGGSFRRGRVDQVVDRDANMYTYAFELRILALVFRYSALLRRCECEDRSGAGYGKWGTGSGSPKETQIGH